MKQQLRPLDVPQKAITQTSAGVRTFDQSRYIGDYERAKVTQIDHAKMRFQRRERIVGYLGTRSRDS
jgi:hypothetical protein